ncbi:MAG: DTW domain-containing protein [Myxococcales bacterium]|nr:DTW domain-containing protein [Myxococcales bacterium]
MPPRLCFCGELTAVQTRTRIVIVRHAAEINKTSNSGRLASLALSNSLLVDHGIEGQALDLTGELGDHPFVLAAGATPLIESPVVSTLVVIDSTWATAKSMRWRIPPLADAPTLSLAAPEVAPLRMRRGAEPEQMATIEAIAAALEFLGEPEPARHLRHLFKAMADRLLQLRGFGMPEKRRS